ncbi:MAG: aminopeptidase P family protein [Fusobacteriaceae bacterium]
MNVVEKIKLIREKMKKNGIQAYLITSSDYHQSEYIGDYFKIREYLSGFSGSFGNLVITENNCALWTDGRYEVQGKNELEGTGITLYVVNTKETPEIKEWIRANVSEKGVLAFDGRTVSAKLGLELKEYLSKKEIIIRENWDIIDEIWSDRPLIEKTKVFILEEKFSGKSVKEKLLNLREEMIKDKIETIVIITLDDIAWLFNLRGRDIKNTPVNLAYAFIEKEECSLYIAKEKLDESILKILAMNKIKVKEYNSVYQDTKNLKKDGKILINSSGLNFSLYNCLEGKEIVDKLLPTTHMKAIKNDIEIKNTKHAHLKDGVAVTKFVYWLKNIVGKEYIDELSVAKKMEDLRKEQEFYIEPSFNTISAYMSNAAMPHYTATAKKYSEIKNKGLYLIDSGGQYLDGTTDITRTIAVGELTPELKRNYTLVLKGMLALSKVKFLSGTTGTNLDILARQAMWEEGINFNHGTGHGVGHVLGVHEGPHGIRMANNSYALEPGVVISNEPGIYVQGSHGVRIENEMLVRNFKETSFGKFYKFETLTMAPIDLEPIEISMLSREEKEFLNDYHSEVYKNISVYLNEKEREWLKSSTRKI